MRTASAALLFSATLTSPVRAGSTNAATLSRPQLQASRPTDDALRMQIQAELAIVSRGAFGTRD